MTDIMTLAGRVVAAVDGLPGMVGVSLGGSAQAGLADGDSDIDLHVYWRAPLAEPNERAARLKAIADSVHVDIRSWGLEDHLTIKGRSAELIYVHLDDLRTHVEQAYGEGLNGEGYTTAVLYSVAECTLLHDPSGIVALIRDRLRAQYPDATRRVLLQHNPPLLQTYLKHLRLAQRRGDLLSVQHRRYTVQMVYFNLLFALNKRYHPGEKRLHIHGERCPIRPEDQTERWLKITRFSADDPELPAQLEAISNELIELVRLKLK
jgi:hypothetical protein